MTQTPATYWVNRDGDAYAARQTLDIASRRRMFERILVHCLPRPQSVIEFGANVGDNLRALRQVIPALMVGVEINEAACDRLIEAADVAHCGAIQSFMPRRQYDLAFTRGVLIHIPPNELPAAYDTLYRSSKRYILVAEYYNPTPVEIEYRGQGGLLWKRDFAGDMLDRYPDLRLLSYGFVYRRDPLHPQDDVSWFLMQKQDAS